MRRIRNFCDALGEYFRNISFKTYVTVLLEGIGLFANVIAIATFFGAQNRNEPKKIR
jgi:hypothetical protein